VNAAAKTTGGGEQSINDWEAECKALSQAPRIINSAALLRASKDKPDFLIHERIPSGAITLLVAKRGSTKSWLVYDLALKVAQGGGRKWLDTPGPEEGAPVLVLSYDNPTEETGRRFKRLGLRTNDPLYFHSVDQNALRMPSAEDKLRNIVHHLQPKLVIVDSFRQAVEGNENDSEAMGKVMSGFKLLAACPSKPAVIIVHHAAKGLSLDGPGARGSGEIEGSADAVMTIEDGAVSWTKSRSWVMSDAFSVTYKLVDHDDSNTTRIEVKKVKP
jgi:RecA-family ATPase